MNDYTIEYLENTFHVTLNQWQRTVIEHMYRAEHSTTIMQAWRGIGKTWLCNLLLHASPNIHVAVPSANRKYLYNREYQDRVHIVNNHIDLHGRHYDYMIYDDVEEEHLHYWNIHDIDVAMAFVNNPSNGFYMTERHRKDKEKEWDD